MLKHIYEKLNQECQKNFGPEDVRVLYKGAELTVFVEKAHVIRALTLLRDHPDFLCQQLVDVCGVDYPSRAPRFEVVYHLLSHRHNFRIRVKTFTDEHTPVPTVVYLYSSADWYEREAFDMFGILFEGHPDLRRILTDYGFMGHPLRKDFPLTGYEEVRYDAIEKKVVYGPVTLPQEYRDFDFTSPWQGITPQSPLLPGDEKATKS